jgi:DNA-binding CsgD family transcriptional regulator
LTQDLDGIRGDNLCANPAAQNMRGVPVTARHLVGREGELGAILRLLDAPEQLPGAAVLSGEAGIGKTTLWLAGIDAAAAHGYRILSSRPSEAETGLSFAGLADLLGNAAADVLPELPPIQQRALEAALLLGESGMHADDRAVAAAFLRALRLLAGDSPLCLGVDDVQWLDVASLAGLRYALARLDHEPVAALLTVRGDVPDWLRRAVPDERLRTVEVGGLSVGAIRELLRTRLDATFPRPTLIRLWETSRGNPLFALELATALQRRGGTLAPGEDLPIPADLDELLHARVDGLSAAALEVARAVAALADPTVTLVEAALGARSDAGLAEALDARILELDGQRLRFTHPLLGSAVAARQTPARRRSLNARLADVVPSAEERARHLALATAEPNRDVASVLEEAARMAHVRGAPAAAADLAEHALRLTPATSPDDAHRRLLIAAEMHSRAGDTDRATALLEQARAAAAPGNERATVLAHLAGVQASPQDAVALYREALLEAEGDDALQATIHLSLAGLMRVSDGLERGIEHGELAVRATSRVADAALRSRALAAYGLAHFNAGHGIPSALMEEALSLERSLTEWPLDDGPTSVFGHQLWWSGEVDRVRALFQEVRSAVTARNDPAGEAGALWFLGFVEWRAGNWEEADRYAAGSLELRTQLGRVMPPDEFPAAVITAHRGQIGDARAMAQGAVARAEVEGIRIAQSGHGWVLGFIELSLGDPEAALEHLRRSHELRNTFILEPGMRLELGDLLEALIAVGELDEADDILATWEARAGALDRAWALAILARCRGLLLAARGDLEGAFASFEHALSEHARSTDPFHHARTLLAFGRTQRRARKRGAARTTLEDALARFERLGAPLWAEQTRAELARIGGRAPSRGELTEAERRIAGLVAEGRTNREVAAALFLTEHSVETALTRVYRKLGVRSRAELAHLLAAKS